MTRRNPSFDLQGAEAQAEPQLPYPIKATVCLLALVAIGAMVTGVVMRVGA